METNTNAVSLLQKTVQKEMHYNDSRLLDGWLFSSSTTEAETAGTNLRIWQKKCFLCIILLVVAACFTMDQ
jgi:hypothetical protein